MEALFSFLSGRRLAVLTGAGCSTESGIPDYRGPATGRPPRNPILHAAFLRSPFVRKRYWARSCLGWPRFASARPNLAHQALSLLEHTGRINGIITQNVDGLHQAAGSRLVVELHGALAKVKCLQCEAQFRRHEMQQRLLEENPTWLNHCVGLAPDGDADLPSELVESFRVPACFCGGDLMPDVVFFGGHVESGVLQSAWDLLERSDALLVVGSSLTVFSGYRFVKRAAEWGMPVAILNQGPTRGDDLAQVCVNAQAGPTLAALSGMSAASASI